MLCLVADDEREAGADPIGRIVASRLRAAMKARGWTQGQLHYQANLGQSSEIIAVATVSALLRGSVLNPGIGTVLALSRALGLTLDQAVGATPMPEAVPLPVEDAAVTRQDFDALRGVVHDLVQRLESRADQASPGRKRRRRSEGKAE